MYSKSISEFSVFKQLKVIKYKFVESEESHNEENRSLVWEFISVSVI